VFGKSERLDSSWPGLDPKGEKSMVTREAHIITLSILPGERGQGLGARLLDHLLDECKRRTAGPRIHLASGSTSFNETKTAPRVHENAPMRTFMEVHPSNASAIALYKSRNFHQVEGSRGVVKHYFRGDNRIPNAIRVKVGGSDAIRLERFDYK
jgi:ribosomal protein S18 acetylase RimI-like enzyme